MPGEDSGGGGHEKHSLKVGGSPSLLFSSLVSYPFTSRCEAGIAPAPVIRAAAAVAGSQECEAGVIDQLCSSVMNFMDDEAARAGAEAKACKSNCRWKKRKNELVDSARKKVKDSCSKGEVPDINAINKGLDGKGKAKLKSLYDSNSRMFDGKAKLQDTDFEPVSSGQAAELGEKGGQVTNLKSAEPDFAKIKPISEFSLANNSSALSAAAAAAKTASVSAPDSSLGAEISGKNAAPGQLRAPAINVEIPEFADIKPGEDPLKYCERLSQQLTELSKANATLAATIAGLHCEAYSGAAQAICLQTKKDTEAMVVKVEAARKIGEYYKALNCKTSQQKICPSDCKCKGTELGKECDDITSLVCLNACNKEEICIQAICPGGWKRPDEPGFDKMSCFLWVFNCKDMSKVQYQKLDGELYIRVAGDKNEISFDDVRQGELGDCFFISSLATIARQHPELIKDMIKENPDGTYSVTFYEKRSVWEFWKPEYTQKTVTVGGEFPINADTKLPEFARYGTDADGNKHELWGLILEKAYAEYKGSYNELKGGHSDSSMELLTGKDSTSYWISKPSISELAELDQKGYGMTLDTRGLWTGGKVETRHTYYVLYVDKENKTITLGDPREGYPPITVTEKDFQNIGGTLIINPLK